MNFKQGKTFVTRDPFSKLMLLDKLIFCWRPVLNGCIYITVEQMLSMKVRLFNSAVWCANKTCLGYNSKHMHNTNVYGKHWPWYLTSRWSFDICMYVHTMYTVIFYVLRTKQTTQRVFQMLQNCFTIPTELQIVYEEMQTNFAFECN